VRAKSIFRFSVKERRPSIKAVMADDDVDHDLLEFMRAHMTGKCQKSVVDSTLGVVENAEQIYDVSNPNSELR
jgi:hypothetical protein